MNQPMHPDDIKELEDEISGFTRWDDNNERYASELEGLNDYDIYDQELADDIHRWNRVSLWAKIKRRVSIWKTHIRLRFDRDYIPF